MHTKIQCVQQGLQNYSVHDSFLTKQSVLTFRSRGGKWWRKLYLNRTASQAAVKETQICICELCFSCCTATNTLSEYSETVELERNDTCREVKYGSDGDDWPVLCLVTAGLLQSRCLNLTVIYSCPRARYLNE